MLRWHLGCCRAQSSVRGIFHVHPTSGKKSNSETWDAASHLCRWYSRLCCHQICWNLDLSIFQTRSLCMWQKSGSGWVISCWNSTKKKLTLWWSGLIIGPCLPQDYVINIGQSKLTPAKYVKNIGVIQDDWLSMERQVNAITRSCCHQLRDIGRLRKNITMNACRTLVQATVTSRLGYANVLLYGLPQYL